MRGWAVSVEVGRLIEVTCILEFARRKMMATEERDNKESPSSPSKKSSLHRGKELTHKVTIGSGTADNFGEE